MNGAVLQTHFDELPVEVYPDEDSLGRAAAEAAAQTLRSAVGRRGQANIIVATGNSQLSFYRALRERRDIDWAKVSIFHMDEYVGMPADHPASFRRYLHEKIVDPVHPAAFYGVQGDAPDPEQECRRYDALLRAHPADLCCLGIGENGHLAFNDPPYAQFDDPVWAKVVKLDLASRRQQVGEGHFPTLADVPALAITVTVPALLAAGQVLCIVPEKRKAPAIQATLSGPISTRCPASILRTVAHARLFVDVDSFSQVPVPGN
jgi:glucosamine-6-phosphate deaminase